MLKIKDKLGKLVALLKDNDSKPEPVKKCCCEHCDCCFCDKEPLTYSDDGDDGCEHMGGKD